MPNCIADNLTPIQRRPEIAAIFSRGLLRLRTTCTNPPEACDSAPDFTDEKADPMQNPVHHKFITGRSPRPRN